MRGWIHAIAICLLILGSCTTHSDTIKLIERAERSMIDHPDSALSIINSIDPENIHGHKDMAHYWLVLAELNPDMNIDRIAIGQRIRVQ